MRLAAALLIALLVPVAFCADDAAAVELPNPGFETPGGGGLPEGWSYYEWGQGENEGATVRDTESFHSGGASLRAESRDASAQAGVYTHIPLKAGRYAMRFWARAEEGKTALVRAYLADRYSTPRKVTDEWTLVEYRRNVGRRHLSAEINVQFAGEGPATVWFDDISIEALPSAGAEIAPDERPAGEQPRLMYFSGNVNHVADTAADWRSRGFDGFFYSYLFRDWTSDIWAEDGQIATVGPDDALFQECHDAIAEAVTEGLTEHALKVAFYSKLPDPFDEAQYGKLLGNMREGVRFARDAGFSLFAIDTEYVSEQYEYECKDYDYTRYSREELAAKLRGRWREVGLTIAREAPGLEVGVLPEGMLYYGPLWMEVFAGLLEGLQEGNLQGDVHVFCEGTYSMRDPDEIREHAEAVRQRTADRLTGEAAACWAAKGKIALGAWPLGYYREVKDSAGKFLGWSGKREKFGDQIVGSYADKSDRYPIEEFRAQLAAIRTYSDRYCWIYGHGASWWQVTEEQADRYEERIQSLPRENFLLATAPNIEDYYKASAERNVIRLTPGEE